ncbi:PfkB family carbohydrate kinase [Chitinivibrio alkaliphilus]|uniref:2-keto-3-deoxygluconate kinase n=1 Tax=Chitinivibrio alkaliphilus ACht1 TaxID=1313304 RepID=U7DCJ7_9BACT|nr:PfkB family carbohydrate kinase [Chitinivibrio alkaliphilus]ERP32160.1 2-keto-3-deoxygluconate kinase [Chitinivibrio alkaliphilus ACht1]
MSKPAHLREYDLTILGELFVEFLAEDAPLADARTFSRSIGGDATYTAVTAARQLAKVQYLSAIGRDPYHALIRSSLKDENINTDLLISVFGNNGINLIDTGVESEDLREYQFNRPGTAAKEITPSLIDKSIITNSRIVYGSGEFQAISKECRQTLFKAFYTGHTNECMVAYDPNLRLHRWSLEDAREALWSILPFVDVLLPSAPQETKALFGYERPVDVIGFLWDRGVNVVVVKNGPAGCMVGYNGKIEEYTCPPTQEKFTAFVHIGSVFNGAFLSSIAKGYDPFHAARDAMQITYEKGASGNGIPHIPAFHKL